MKKILVTCDYWYNVNNREEENGYCLTGYNTENNYFEAKTKEECIKYAENNNYKIMN